MDEQSSPHRPSPLLLWEISRLEQTPWKRSETCGHKAERSPYRMRELAAEERFCIRALSPLDSDSVR